MSYEKGSFKYAVIPDMEELERLMRTNAELLEALKEILRVHVALDDMGHEVLFARQAIAKAEGK